MKIKSLSGISWLMAVASLPLATLTVYGQSLSANRSAEVPVLEGPLHQAAVQMVGAQAEIDALRAQVRTLQTQNAALQAQASSQNAGLIAAGMGIQEEITRSDLNHAMAAGLLVIVPFFALLWYGQRNERIFKRRRVAETIAS